MYIRTCILHSTAFFLMFDLNTHITSALNIFTGLIFHNFMYSNLLLSLIFSLFLASLGRRNLSIIERVGNIVCVSYVVYISVIYVNLT